MPTVTEHHVPVEGADLYVKEAGTGPPLLLIHGSGINADTWGPIFDDLARDFRVVAYDRRGFSRSHGKPTARWQVHGSDAAAVVRSMDAGPVAVVGWSSGGIVALDLAVAEPRLVSHPVLLEPPLHAIKHLDRTQVRAFLRSQIAARRRGPAAGVVVFMEYTCGYRGGGSLWADYPQENKDTLRANSAGLLVELRAARRDRHLNARALGRLTVPVTIAYGARTQLYFERCAKAAAKLVPGAELRTIPGANHALGTSAPEETATLIRAAVSSPG